MKTYTHQEATEASIKYFDGDELAANVFVSKYALRDLEGNLYEAVPTDMHRRLAREFARIESKYPNPMSEKEIFSLLANVGDRSLEDVEAMSWEDLESAAHGFGPIVAQGSPMSAIGNPFQFQSLSNCFVIESPHDSYGGIMKTDQEQVQIMKRRGGVGFDISSIRPKGIKTANAARTTDGIGIFMERFSNTCREVAQGGRRGALMLCVSCVYPQILDFIDIKRDLTKVTGANLSIRFTDDFMRAVKSDSEVTLKYPVDSNAPIVSHQEKATKIWDAFTDAAWTIGDPAPLFWDTIKRRCPADIYSGHGFGSTATNPCLTGDVKIALADGRGCLSIKQLADEGKDVPVYCYDNSTGKLAIKLMRNPRLTGINVPVFNVTIEGGHSFKATGNHVMIMRDGTKKRVDELLSGDQLWVAHKIAARFCDILPHYGEEVNVRAQDYLWIKDCNSRGWKSEHREIWRYNNGKISKGHVIHHSDFDAQNNAIDNLRLMSTDEHNDYHSAKIRGKNNPIFKVKADPERYATYVNRLSVAMSGNNNPRAYEISQEDFVEHVKQLTSTLRRRITQPEWLDYAKNHSLPAWPNTYRTGGLNLLQFFSKIAIDLGFNKHVSADARLLRRLDEATAQGYVADIVNHRVVVGRTCEWCGKEFVVPYTNREHAFCSHSCANFYSIRKTQNNVARADSLRSMHAKKALETRKKQLDVYTQLQFTLGRVPLADEWTLECKAQHIPFRTGTKNGFKNWSDIKASAAFHNHRVVSVEPCTNEDVYNGTVDDEHTLCMALGFEQHEQYKNPALLMVASENCGEITLSPYDSCRLLLVNLVKFVVDPFTPFAKFDYVKFDLIAQKAQRLMDDLVDLEIEAIDKILEKIKADPEPADVKVVETNLWEKIRSATVNGRRTGLGVTAVGDALAYQGVRYGSDASIKMTGDMYKALCLASYRSSVTMAKERGPFPVYSHELEVGHPFIEQVMNEDPELRSAYDKFGRRNIANTTTPPAGSVSIETQTSSGPEPVFMLSYKRRKKINPNDESASVDFIDKMGDKWQEFTVYHHGLKKWAEVTGKSIDCHDESPYHGATAHEIDWLKKVDLQAAAQKWVCHSISSTVNLPKEATVQDVKNVYMHAWESGCKGITVYRDGSRDGVMVSNSSKPSTDKNGTVKVVERPKELPCDIHRVNVKGESYLVLVGLLNGEPYEVFAGRSEYVEVPKKAKSGVLIKNGKKDGLSTYNLKIPVGDDDFVVFKDVVELFQNPTYGAFTRTISLAIRHGAPVNNLVEQLRKDKNSDITSFSSVIARVLAKGYIPDGTKLTNGAACPNCGSNNVAYLGGCATCMACGHSKCQ